MENPVVSDSLSLGETESEGETVLPPGPDSAKNTMPELDSKTDLPLESDSETNPPSETGDSNDTKNPSDVNTPATVTDTAATAEELLAWLDAHKSGSGTLELTADIYMEDFSFMNNRSKELTIDTKEYSIIFTGEAYFWCSRLTIRGQGGDKGVLRVAAGGALSMGYMTVEAAAQNAVFQEEGAGLIINECSLDENSIHFAQTPFVWSYIPALAIVEPEQTVTGALPETVKVYGVNRLGKMDKTDYVPVTWALAEHESSQEKHLRFDMEGVSPGIAFLKPPVCTVVYNDYLLTFTWIDAVFNGRSYIIKGDCTKPEDRLPIDLDMEYSFDGENWLCDETYLASEVSAFYFTLRRGAGEGAWDSDACPWLWFRLHWSDDGMDYYSNILRFSGENFGVAEDHGGNRGGGTDITAPPEPEPDTEAPPDAKPEPDTDKQPDTKPGTKPEPDTEAPPDIKPGMNAEAPPDTKPEPDTKAPPDTTPHLNSEQPPATHPYSDSEQHPAVDPQPDTVRQPAKQPQTKTERSTDTSPQPDSSSEIMTESGEKAAMTSEKSPDTKSGPVTDTATVESGKSPFLAKVLPVIAGCATIAVLIGAAGIYLSPGLRKKLIEALKKLFR